MSESRRTTVSELAKMLAERKANAVTPRVMVKMVKQGELQFELETVPDLPDDVFERMLSQALTGARTILAASNGGSDAGDT